MEQNGYEDLPRSQQDYSHNHEASSKDKDAAPTVTVSTQSADANVTFKLGRNRLEKACTPDTVGRQVLDFLLCPLTYSLCNSSCLLKNASYCVS